MTHDKIQCTIEAYVPNAALAYGIIHAVLGTVGLNRKSSGFSDVWL